MLIYALLFLFSFSPGYPYRWFRYRATPMIMKAWPEPSFEQVLKLQETFEMEDLRDISISNINDAHIHFPIVANWADENHKRLKLDAWSTQNVTLLYMRDSSPISIDVSTSSATAMTIAVIHGNITVSGVPITCGATSCHIPARSCVIQLSDSSEALVVIDTVHKCTLQEVIASFSDECIKNNKVSLTEEKKFLSYINDTCMTGFINETIRSSLMNSVKDYVLNTLDDSITFDTWLGSYLTRRRLYSTSLPSKMSDLVKKYSVQSTRRFLDTREMLLALMDDEIKLRRREGVRVSYMGRDDGRGMQVLFINGESFFLPPPLNKFVGAIICGHRELDYGLIKPYLQTREDETEIIQKVTLESSPFFRILSALIQKEYLYPVNS